MKYAKHTEGDVVEHELVTYLLPLTPQVVRQLPVDDLIMEHGVSLTVSKRITGDLDVSDDAIVAELLEPAMGTALVRELKDLDWGPQ